MTHPYEEVFAETQRRALYALRQWPPAMREDSLAIAWMRACEKGIGTRGLYRWLVVVAHREANRIMRTDSERLARDVWTSERADSDPADRVLALLEHEDRRVMVRALKDPQRKALVLQALGYSRREVSEMVGTGTFTWVNRHLTEGRRALREMAA